ncbi:hypothetical protein J6590_026488 [Homalodisca vitripennis]|nr:hypothetical protein J6590_026488 [Homalodisca vitripennis]
MADSETHRPKPLADLVNMNVSCKLGINMGEAQEFGMLSTPAAIVLFSHLTIALTSATVTSERDKLSMTQGI